MKQIWFRILEILFFSFICVAPPINANEFSIDRCENEQRDKTFDALEIEDFIALQDTKNDPSIGCVGVLNSLKKQFSDLILFEIFILPTLNDRRASLVEIQRMGDRYSARLINTIHRYNPSLNTKVLKESIRNLINKTANGLIIGNLDNHQVRHQIKHDFNHITQFWKKFIFPNFAKQRVNANFRRTINLIAKLNSPNFNRLNGRFHRNFAAYQALVTSTLNIINGIG